MISPRISGRPYGGQVEAESLSRSNELDEMREQLESRELAVGNMTMHPKVVKEKVKKQEEQLSTEIRSLLVAGTALSVASKRLQVMSVIYMPNLMLLFIVFHKVEETHGRVYLTYGRVSPTVPYLLLLFAVRMMNVVDVVYNLNKVL